MVIPLGSVREPDWLPIILTSLACLAVAALLLYFWIVVLELFIRFGPHMYDPGMVYGSPPMAPPMGAGQMYPGTVPMGQYPGTVPQSMMPPPQAMYYQPGMISMQQPQSLTMYR